MADIDADSLADEISDQIAHDLENTRRLAEHYAHNIMPRAGRRLAEVKVVDSKIYLVMTSHGAHIDEFGSVDQHPNAPLRRAIDATGLRFVPLPKP